MDSKNSTCTGLAAGAVTLADIAIKNPDGYDERIMLAGRYGRKHDLRLLTLAALAHGLEEGQQGRLG